MNIACECLRRTEHNFALRGALAPGARLLWDLKVNLCSKQPATYPYLSWLNPTPDLPRYLCNIYFNIISQLILGVSVHFSLENLKRRWLFCVCPSRCYVPGATIPPWLDRPDICSRVLSIEVLITPKYSYLSSYYCHPLTPHILSTLFSDILKL
jgi:hypothetical protein